QRLAIEFLQRGIVHQRDVRGQHARIYAAGPFAAAAHALDDFIESGHGGKQGTRTGERRRESLREQGAGGWRIKQHGAGEILHQRALAQGHQFRAGLRERGAHGAGSGQVGGLGDVRGVVIVQSHAVVGGGVQRGFDGGKAARGANGGAFAVHQIVGDVNHVVIHAGAAEVREIGERGGSYTRFFFPVARGPVRLGVRINLHQRRGLREVVNFGRLGEAAQEGL